MLQLLSFLSNLLWLVGVIIAVVVAIFVMRIVLRRLGRAHGTWVAYTRPVEGRDEVEVGVKRNKFLSEPIRMPLKTISASKVSEDPSNLYELQSRAQETATTMNARQEQAE